MVSCSVQETEVPAPVTEDEDVEFHASIEVELSRAYVDERLLVLWNADDRVSIFNKTTFNQEYAFTGNDGDNFGTFAKVPNENFLTANSLDLVYSVYPYKESTKISNDGTLTVDLPAKQAYRENSFGKGANTMIAISRDNELMFKNLCGYLAISLYGKDVTVSSITIKGNNDELIAGSASVTANLDSIPSLVFNATEATDEITMVFDNPVKLGSSPEEATEFWFVVPPTVFKNGFTVTLKDDKDGVFDKSTRSSLEIRRSIRSRMSALEVEPIPHKNFQPLTLEAIEDGTVTLMNPLDLTIEYSIDSTEWVSTATSASIALKQGQKLFFRGNNEAYAKFANSSYTATRISSNSPCYVYGNIMSLFDSNDFPKLKRLVGECALAMLFMSNRQIRNHPEKDLLLPATELSSSCYYRMFDSCTSLAEAPDLPATTLQYACYGQMFYGCTSLTKAPDLPAETLANYCYDRMFYGCTSLAKAPDLPATTLQYGCYRKMFSVCTSLTKAPDLPATTLQSVCYEGMFSGCTSLTKAPDLPAETLAGYCYFQMFSGCTSLTKAPALPAETLQYYCYYEMFSGCTSLTKAPDLPAEFPANYCYSGMFKGCSNLSYIKAMFLPGSLDGSPFTEDWVQGVAPQGTFVKNSMAVWDITGADGVPEGWNINKEEGKFVYDVMLYKKHTKGKAGVSLVILSDGFTSSELQTFRQHAIECYDFLFTVEPYKTYAEYFDAFILSVPSEESGISETDGNGRITKYVNSYFETRWGANSYSDMSSNADKIWSVVSLCISLDENQAHGQIPVALLVNDTRYGGMCISYSSGKSYCIIPYAYAGQSIYWGYPGYQASSDEDGAMVVEKTPSSVYSELGRSRGDWKNTFIHEFGGHGFGRLGDEYWYGDMSSFKYWTSATISGHRWSVPMRLNLSASYDTVPWQEFLDHWDELVAKDAHYSRIGKFQGGNVVMFKIWRSEKTSCMIDNRPYFSAWQRYLIAKRIMTLAGEGENFSFDSWLALDKTDDPLRDNESSSTTRSIVTGPIHFAPPLPPPVLIEDE